MFVVHPFLEGTSRLVLNEAQKLVDEAVRQQSIYNAYRVANPKRNRYVLRHSAPAMASKNKKRSDEPVPPKLDAKLRKAAALVAEHHAAQQKANGMPDSTSNPHMNRTQGPVGSPHVRKRDASTYWLANIEHTGLPPMGANSSYPVYRDVTNPIFAGGAKGDGVTDDTDAINAAIAYGDNCGEDCLSSSIKGTLIYFPPGTYLISSPINAYYYSQLVGDVTHPPTIQTTPGFIGLGAIQSDVYIPDSNGEEWYIVQSNFYRQVRNFVIKIGDTTTKSVAGIHWQVAQATSLTNVAIFASRDAATTQMGMFTENGSGGFMSDCTIDGGKYGIYGGNQQYTVRNFMISSQTTACICLIWDWGWTWSNIVVANSPVGIMLLNPETPSVQPPGSIYLLDSAFMNVEVGIKAQAMKKDILETSIMTFDNVKLVKVNQLITFSDGKTFDYPLTIIAFLILGNVRSVEGSEFGHFTAYVPRSPTLVGSAQVTDKESYFVKSRPQYYELDVGSVLNVKDYGAKGDGVTDDTSAIVAALAVATTSNLIYFPAGSYIVTTTLLVPPHTRMTGEVWSQIVASGEYFADLKNPKPMVRVGNPGDIGTVEISDMLFTSTGALPGLVLMEWNVQAETQGSVGIWDAHFRLGGAYGSDLQVAQCPKVTSIPSGCVAASMMLHITPQSNGYFENMWVWIADHDLDDPDNTMVTVAAARGILVESAAGPTWLYSTASEHAMLYQYNFYNTSNVFAGMIQTESPYFQYTTATESPGPFKDSIGLFNNDPDFSSDSCNGKDLECNISWAVMAQDAQNVTIAGAGLYSWFSAYDQSVCVDAQNCQQRLFNDQGNNGGFWVWNLVTIGAVEMISNTYSGESIYAKENTQATAHPFWSALASYSLDYVQMDQSCPDDDTSEACRVQTMCDKTRRFVSLEELAAASGSFPDSCNGYYALGVLESILGTSTKKYAAANDGYDDVFGKYVEYVKEMATDAVSAFMASSGPGSDAGGPGNKYFECTFESDGLIETQKCPWRKRQLAPYDSYTITYKLVDENGFYDELKKTYGISKDWVAFGRVSYKTRRTGCFRDVCYEPTDIELINFPKASENMQVSNPKDIITKALPKVNSLQTTISARKMDLASSMWSGTTDDILQVISMPVFMIQQALTSMETAKELGQAQAKKDKINLILTILGIVFAFVPFLDELLPEIELLGGIFTIIATAGNVALGIQAIIADPTSAPMEILGLLTAGGSKRAKDYSSMATARRGIQDEKLGKIGATFKKMDDQFQSIIKHKCKL
ncbi:hypothetical protein QQS21_000330 [Conoideocrella luteorostrata]|uniref:Rhamnogalacturonase A/B/Epimerase-like pectate lyase domain-containing protein n=1 Tax=Conoideocrella luteorostrata TaxID=1105319 RepID=A0AAJ0G434_9HYPO|nr:hypothetical protein QQS21_000330 [Conoideocrella luteorostrata]